MQRTTTNINRNILELPADTHRLMMQCLSVDDLIKLSQTCRHFRKQVKEYLATKTTDPHIQMRYHSQLFRVKTDRINDYIEDAMDSMSDNPTKQIFLLFGGTIACVSLGIAMHDIPAIRNTLLTIGAVLLLAGIVLSVRCTLINRRIDRAYQQIDQLNNMEAGRLPRRP